MLAVLASVGYADPTGGFAFQDAETASGRSVSAEPERNYLNSGWVTATGSGTAPVLAYSGVVRIPNKMWLRLHFGAATLSGERGDANASYLVLTGEADGAVQILWMEDLEDWAMSSAYFNGDRVRVEIYASPQSGPSAVQVNGVEFGEPGWLDRSLCGPTDDRYLSADPRTARVLPSQCTAWLVSDLTSGLLSAGHCAIGERSVVEFNVPLSTVGGSMVHPDPSDQYPVDAASVQTQSGSIGVGNDWMFFGIHANTSTGKTALAAQGTTHHLAAAMPPDDNRQVGVVGYGQVSQPMPLEYNFVQTAGLGQFLGAPGHVIKYTADTTGGNSGSPVLDLTTGLAIGIHTNGGCNSNGFNRGTAATRSSLLAALAHPLGAAADTGGVRITFPQGRPATVNPGGGTKLIVRVRASETRTPAGGTARLHVFDGVSWAVSAMVPTSDEVYRGTFPAIVPCVARVRYFVTVENTLGEINASPEADRLFEAEVGLPSEVLGEFGFGNDEDWLVANDPLLRSGGWTVADPPSVGRLGPKSDYDASGRCLLTGGVAREDIDGGSTNAFSPLVRTCPGSDPYISMALWHAATAPDDPGLSIEVSVDRGASWVEIDRIDRTDGWEMRVYRLRDFVTPGNDLLVHFTASDIDAPGWPEGGIVESAVDRFRVFVPLCSSPGNDFGDGPGVLNPTEIGALIVSAMNGNADPTGDGAFDARDLFEIIDGARAPCR